MRFAVYFIIDRRELKKTYVYELIFGIIGVIGYILDKILLLLEARLTRWK